MLNQIKTMQINVNMRHLTLEVKQLQATSAATTATANALVLHMQHTEKNNKKQEANQSCLLQLVKFKQQQKLMMNFIIRFGNVQQRCSCAAGVAAGVVLNEGRPRQRSAHRTLSNVECNARRFAANNNNNNSE